MQKDLCLLRILPGGKTKTVLNVYAHGLAWTKSWDEHSLVLLQIIRGWSSTLSIWFTELVQENTKLTTQIETNESV